MWLNISIEPYCLFLKLDMVKAELELYEEQCNGVSKKLQEATSSLKKINEDKEARERYCRGI